MRIHVYTSIASRATLAALVAAVAACSETPTLPTPQVSASAQLNRVIASPEAAVIAAGATLQLTIAGATLDSTPVATFDTVIYKSGDSSRVKVSATGLITAQTGAKAITATPVQIISAATKDGVTRADTTYVAVVASAGTNPTFSIADPSAATTKLGSGGTPKSIFGTVTYKVGGFTLSMGASAVPLTIRLSAQDGAALASASSFSVMKGTGSVLVTATTNVFGTTLTDTITYMFGDPTSYSIVFGKSGLTYYQGTSATAPFNDSTTITLQAVASSSSGGGGGIGIGIPIGTIGDRLPNGTPTLRPDLVANATVPVASVTFINNTGNTTDTLGVSFTAVSGGPAPADVTGLNVANFFQRSATVSLPVGTYTYVWTGPRVASIPVGQRGGKIVVH